MSDAEFLDTLERDLKHKRDRKEAVGVLMGLVSGCDIEIRRKAVRCLGKMAQNKYDDQRIIASLVTLHGDPDGEIREDAAWGIGEALGTMYDERVPDAITELLSDPERAVRGMAAWAAGRLIHKRDVRDQAIIGRLTDMIENGSDYEKGAADFALNGK